MKELSTAPSLVEQVRDAILAEILQVIVREDAKAEAASKTSGDPGSTSGK